MMLGQFMRITNWGNKPNLRGCRIAPGRCGPWTKGMVWSQNPSVPAWLRLVFLNFPTILMHTEIVVLILILNETHDDRETAVSV